MADKKEDLHKLAGDALAGLAAGNIGAQNVPKPQNTKKTQKARNKSSARNVSRGTKAKNPPGRPKTYTDVHRFSFNLDGETYKYLKAAAYNASSPEHMVTVTEYINRLIQADKKKNGGKK